MNIDNVTIDEVSIETGEMLTCRSKEALYEKEAIKLIVKHTQTIAMNGKLPVFYVVLQSRMNEHVNINNT